jgi:hypothetical protein
LKIKEEFRLVAFDQNKKFEPQNEVKRYLFCTNNKLFLSLNNVRSTIFHSFLKLDQLNAKNTILATSCLNIFI